MTLTKNGQKFATDNDTVLRAYLQNGWVEVKEEPEKKPAPSKNKKIKD